MAPEHAARHDRHDVLTSHYRRACLIGSGVLTLGRDGRHAMGDARGRHGVLPGGDRVGAPRRARSRQLLLHFGYLLFVPALFGLFALTREHGAQAARRIGGFPSPWLGLGHVARPARRRLLRDRGCTRRSRVDQAVAVEDAAAEQFEARVVMQLTGALRPAVRVGFTASVAGRRVARGGLLRRRPQRAVDSGGWLFWLHQPRRHGLRDADRRERRDRARRSWRWQRARCSIRGPAHAATWTPRIDYASEGSLS